jgi:hypothetical protein
MKCKQLLVAGSLLLAAHGAAAEAALDTSKPLVCGATHVVECTALGECARGAPEAFNLPVLLRIDIPNKVVGSARAGGEKRKSAIASVTEADGVTALQGVDGAHAWSSRIDRSTGGMTVVLAGDGLGYLVFGTCASL